MKKRYLAAGFCSLALCSGFTLAYMRDQGQVINSLSFIGEKGMDAVLTEPSWNPEKADMVLPGAVIPKDPCVTNTSEEDIDELVALQVEFLYSAAHPDKEKRGQVLTETDMREVSEILWIDYDADTQQNWVRFEEEDEQNPVQHFYYGAVLERNYPGKGDVTVPLFQNIVIDEACQNEQFALIQNMGGIDIRVTGCVLQQMDGETEFGLDHAKAAYEAGLFLFG